MVDEDRIRKVCGVGVVRAVDEDHMNESHARHQWKDAEGHDLILPEKALIADVSTRKADSYDDQGEDSTPPAVQKCWVIGDAGPPLWRRLVVEGTWQDHGGRGVQTDSHLRRGRAVGGGACSVGCGR